VTLEGRVTALAAAVRDKINAMQGDRYAAIVLNIEGGGAVVAAGAQVELQIPANLTLLSWAITADAAGDAVVDILKSTYANYPTVASIAGTEKPTLTAAQKNQNTTIASWTTALSQGDILRANVVSAATVKRLTVTLRCKRT
jgi:hypothetical protein